VLPACNLLASLAAAFAASSVGAQQSRLFTDCRGAPSASPTVILESGAFGTSADWDLVLASLSAGGRVCAFDRAGLGGSTPDSNGKDAVSRGEEIGRLLDQIGEARPVILVGHSNGALYALAFAKLHPERVAGLVYVNGAGPDDLDDPALVAAYVAERRMSNLAVAAGRLGVAPLVATALTREESLSGDAARRKRKGLTCRPCLAVARDEDMLILPGLAAVRDLPGRVTAIPTVVITGDPHPATGLADSWRRAETASARRASKSWILEAPGASHVSPLSRDLDYIDAAVGWLRSLAL